MSTCAFVRSFIESKITEVQTSNVGFTSEVSDYLVVHTGPEVCSLLKAFNWLNYLHFQLRPFYALLLLLLLLLCCCCCCCSCCCSCSQSYDSSLACGLFAGGSWDNRNKGPSCVWKRSPVFVSARPLFFHHLYCTVCSIICTASFIPSFALHRFSILCTAPFIPSFALYC